MANENGLGKLYRDGDVIVRQGEIGDCMFVIQNGTVTVSIERPDGTETHLATLEAGDIFGEMAILQKERRSATVKARDEARVLTVDRRTFLRRVKEDPTLALHTLEALSNRIRKMNRELEEARHGAARAHH